MAEKKKTKTTVEALSKAGVVIRGRLFESDSEAVTVDVDGVHYEVLLEYVTNAEEFASVKRGEAVEVRVALDAKILEKRLIEPQLPGIITGKVFGQQPGWGLAACTGVCDECGGHCTECSYCNCNHDCSFCSQCISYCARSQSFARTPESRFTRR